VTQMGHIWKQRNDIFISQGEQGLEEFYQKEILFAVDNLERDSTLVRLMKNYSDEELFNDPILQELNQLALSYSNVEGNLLYEHPLKSMSDSFNVAFYEKRYNLFQLAKSRTKILEIGFNAGHSLLLMLTANPDIESLSFDLNFHAYTRPCFDFLKRYFPKIDIRFGDSREEVANYCNENPKKFDMIHVDGSHDVNFAAIDYENVKKLATQDTIVVFDDASRGSPLYDFLQLKFACNEIRSVDRDELGLKSTSLHEIFTFIR
ncbi:MAG: class I SAM-dependent methyltransferase, partial [Nitrosarchaeum sp.]|nr:class I SAM-dependent methyltransferase [Nitrosarchaeum sp.]